MLFYQTPDWHLYGLFGWEWSAFLGRKFVVLKWDVMIEYIIIIIVSKVK